jgi:hypothetical protein
MQTRHKPSVCDCPVNIQHLRATSVHLRHGLLLLLLLPLLLQLLLRAPTAAASCGFSAAYIRMYLRVCSHFTAD